MYMLFKRRFIFLFIYFIYLFIFFFFFYFFHFYLFIFYRELLKDLDFMQRCHMLAYHIEVDQVDIRFVTTSNSPAALVTWYGCGTLRKHAYSNI